MIKIGDFAKIFDISIKTVRFYEEEGLIEPNYIDIYTGYRYFDDNNIKRMHEILVLKNLGFSLQEIRTFDDSQIDKKIKDLETDLIDINKRIKFLNQYKSKGKEGVNMKTFINDENVIGKWSLVGVSESISEAKNNKFIDDAFFINELYFMPKGERYWVIEWTNGVVYINETENKYEIENDNLYLTLTDEFDPINSKVAVYKREDNKVYSKDEIRIKDDIAINNGSDEELIGFWKAIDYIRNINAFTPHRKFFKEKLFLNKIAVNNDRDVFITYSDGYIKNSKYTKDYIFNICVEDTACKYQIKNIDGKDYLFVEWKSGDYVYGKFVSGYYVLERQ